MNWILEDGNIEKWLLIQEEKKVNGAYHSFWIVRCNYLMKWIDSQGHLQQSWSYFVSSLSDKIKGNFRTWHSLITPQPNKYAELLLPKYPIERATNFIVEEESWSVVEYDHTSVPGIIYLSLTENKINKIYDDVANNIADTDKLAKYSLELPLATQIFKIHEPITPKFTIKKNGKPYDAEIELIPTNKKVAKIINGVLQAVGEGTTDIIIQLKDYPNIKQNMTVVVSSDNQEFSGYISGPDKLSAVETGIYQFKGTSTLENEVVFSINNDFAIIESQINNQCTIKVKPNPGIVSKTFILTAIYDGQEYIKEILISPIW